MATASQIGQFITTIAPLAQKAYKNLGKVKPSVCIGMACVESAYGTSKIMSAHNAYFGQKVGTGKTATKYWSGNFYTSRTSEEYTIGKHTVISAAFRAYDSMEQSVFNYYELLNTSLYKRVLATSDYKEQMAQIKACGYMTSSTEVNSVLNIINKYNLTKYDPDDLVVGNPYTEPFAVIKKGSKGEGVKWLQYELNKHGYNLVIDGIAGDKTIDAVKNYQLSFGLKADGIVGIKTRTVLKHL